MKNTVKKVLALLLVMVLCLGTIDISVYADILETYVSNSSVKYYGSGFLIEFSVDEKWDSAFKVTIEITNTSTVKIEDWEIVFPFKNNIFNIWNAVIETCGDDIYVIKNAEWNQDILPGETYSFEFIAEGELIDTPSFFILPSSIQQVDQDKYNTNFYLIDDWGTGYTGNVVIENVSTDAVEDWILEFDFDKPITSIWNGKIISCENNHYVISNADYNQNIPAGDGVIIGFQGDDGNVISEPMEYVLYSYTPNKAFDYSSQKRICIDASNLTSFEEGYYYFPDEKTSLTGSMYPIDEISNAFYTVKNHKGDVVKTGNIEIIEEWSIDDICLLLSLNEVEITACYTDGTEKNESIWLYNFDKSKMAGLDIDLGDTDGDGLVNYLEYLYDTDENIIDTDGDGVNDYYELVYLGTNPAVMDTDGDGILDGQDDPDKDGISSYDEFIYETDPATRDSDGDLLTDYEELFVYNTDPTSKDTDGDCADDYWELENNFDPLTYNEVFSISESKSNGVMEVTVELDARGDQVSSLQIENHESDLLINESIPGYLGSAFDFSFDGTFEVANVSIVFEESLLLIEDFNPVLYYFNEMEQLLEEIPTTWDGASNEIFAQLEHFSTYILLNKTEFDTVWEDEFAVDETETVVPLKIVFAIDSSASMSRNDSGNIRLSVAKQFVNKMTDADEAAVISFDAVITVLAEFTSDKETLNDAIGKVGNRGSYTYIGKAILKSLELFDSVSDETTNYIILLTDGLSHDSMPDYQAICDELNIKIYTIGLGSSIDETLLANIANNTGGKYYHASVASDLEPVFEEVEKEIIIVPDKVTDSNRDGISDYYTRQICSGTLRTGTKSTIFTDVDYENLQANNDYDGDGLLNGEEVQIVEKHTKIYINVLTDPEDEDTDDDGYSDYDEVIKYGTDPLQFDILESDFNRLTNDDLYLSSLFSNAYLEDVWLEVQLFAGNAILNHRVNYVNSYKNALYTYITIMYENNIEEWALKDLKEQMHTDILQTIDAIYDWTTMLTTVPGDTLNYATYAQLLIDRTSELVIKDAELFNVNNMMEAADVITDIVSEKTKLQADYMTIMYKYQRDISKVDDFNLSGKLAERLGNIMYRLPDGVKKTLQGIQDATDGLDYVFVGLGTFIDVVNSLQAFSVINALNANYDKAATFLDAIIIYTENDDMLRAALDIKAALSDQFAAFLSGAAMICENVLEGATEAGKIALVSSLGPVAWAIDLGISLGDMVFNTGEVDTLSLYTIALGDAAVCVSKSAANIVEKDTDLFYIIKEYYMTKIEILCSLRIVGENNFYAASNARGLILKLFGSQSDIEDTCKNNIKNVCKVAEKSNIYVNPYYEGYEVSID